MIFLTGILFLGTVYLGEAIFGRFANTFSGANGNSNDRLEIWNNAIHQFADNPLFGNSLQATSVHTYPHNIFIEVMITTGIIGLIPFLFFIAYLFKLGIQIIKNKPSLFWIFVIFLQGLTQSMFSGAIYDSSILAAGAGLLIGSNNGYFNFKIFNKKSNEFLRPNT